MGGLCPFPNLRIREITPLRAASSIRLKKDPCIRREEAEQTRFQTSIFTVEKKRKGTTKITSTNKGVSIQIDVAGPSCIDHSW